MIPTLKISAVQVLGLAALGVLAGTWLKRRVPLLDRLNIPAPIVGGMLYAVAALVLHYESVNLEADVVLRDLPMVAFMTTIGLSARLQLIRQGGARVIWFLGVCRNEPQAAGCGIEFGAEPQPCFVSQSTSQRKEAAIPPRVSQFA